jgi:hypothetical protein
MVLQEEEQKNGDQANKNANDGDNKPDDEYYQPFCIDCLQEFCSFELGSRTVVQ